MMCQKVSESEQNGSWRLGHTKREERRGRGKMG